MFIYNSVEEFFAKVGILFQKFSIGLLFVQN